MSAHPTLNTQSKEQASPSKRILVVEDEDTMRGMIAQYLTAEGYEVEGVATGSAALSSLEGFSPDLVLLDWMLPGGMSGLDVCREMRHLSPVAIIMLTARTEEPDMVLGLEMGADDYVRKPFRMRELVARIRTVLRRAAESQRIAESQRLTEALRGESRHAPRLPRSSGGGSFGTRPGENVIVRGDLVIEPDKFVVRKQGQTVTLTPAEFKILLALASRPGVVFNRLQLSEIALDDDYAHYERTIDTHVSHLRKKLESDTSQPAYIQTVYGIGYRFGVNA